MLPITKPDNTPVSTKGDIVKKEYDFSGAVKGKFYTKVEDMEIPVYLDKTVMEFYRAAAQNKKTTLDKLVNSILKKEMEILKSIE